MAEAVLVGRVPFPGCRSLVITRAEGRIMTNISPEADTNAGWSTRQAYAMAAGCLFLGLVIGYLFRGSESPRTATSSIAQTASGPQAPHSMPTMEQMKAMGDKQALSLLAQLKGDPDNAVLLA